jgi:hypothetical protein
MNQKLIISFLFGVLLLSSCLRKDIDYEYEFDASEMVINGMLHQNGIELDIRKLVSPLEQDEESLLKDVVVSLFEDNGVILELDYDSDQSLYVSPNTFTPEFGKAYHIKAVHKEFGVAYSDVFSLPFYSDSIAELKVIKKEGVRVVDLIITMKDTTEQFYNVNWVDRSQEDATIITDFPIFSREDFVNDTLFQRFELFEGDEIDYQLYVYKLSRSYYEFLESFSEYNTVFDDPMIDQVPDVISNIHGGKGFVGACIREHFEFD